MVISVKRQITGFLMPVSFLALAALLLNFIFFHDYNPMAAEVWLLLAVVAGVAIFSWLLGWVWLPLGVLLTAIWIFIYLDQAFSISNGLGLGTSAALLFYLTAITLVAALLYHLGPQGWQIVLTIFVVIMLSVLLAGQFAVPNPNITADKDKSAPLNEQLPPVIHLVLDGHIGSQWMPLNFPGAKEAKASLYGLLEKYGFRLYPRTYSRYYKTRDSLTNGLDFTELKKSSSTPISHIQSFARLKDEGYRLRVYQTEHLDFCQAKNVSVDFCYRYLATSIKGLEGVDLPSGKKALVIAGHWLGSMPVISVGRSLLAAVVRRLTGYDAFADLPLVGNRALYDRSASLNSMSALQRVMEDVKQQPNGQFFFAHVVTPHDPFMYGADCSLNSDSWSWSSTSGWVVAEMDEKIRHDRYRRYYAQMRCIHRSLGSWFADLDRAGIMEKATIVLHGDHGSRIASDPSVKNSSDPNWQRMTQDSFSTLFALRKPGVAPGVSTVMKPLNIMLKQLYISPELLDQPSDAVPFILLHKNWDSESEPLQKQHINWQ